MTEENEPTKRNRAETDNFTVIDEGHYLKVYKRVWDYHNSEEHLVKVAEVYRDTPKED